MAILEKDIKKLWGRAGGQCAFPGCGMDLVPYLDENDPTVIGEMAHVISKGKGGPRSNGSRGPDTYDNLILLCPTHHTIIDHGSERKFTEQLLKQWKSDHESAVAKALASPSFDSRQSLFAYIRRLLIENKACWAAYGPDSLEAKANPLSNAHHLWEFRKLQVIVPNNTRIVNAIARNSTMVSEEQLGMAMEFREHAAGFERNCYERIDGVSRFPLRFEEMLNDEW